MPDHRYLSILAAAKLLRTDAGKLGVSRGTVYKRIAEGQLKAEKIAGRLVVVRSSLRHVEKPAPK